MQSSPIFEGAFKADFGHFSEVVLSNGTVIRQIATPGGGYTYSIISQDVNADEFMINEGVEGEWAEIESDEAERWYTEAIS